MNHLSSTSNATVSHGLPSARALALMAMRVDSRGQRADPAIDVAAGADTAGPGWFESSFELGRGLSVFEGSVALADEWLRLAAAGRAPMRAPFSGVAA